ncbi:MAG: citrate synthase [Gammaproteobacteria bacterium]|jgi:citrate synthase
MIDKVAKLTIDNTPEIDLPIYKATYGPELIDVAALTKHQFFTYDPGFTSTAACKSAITYIDGDKGILLHRGYPIDQLAFKTDFLSTAYLLLKGELPNAQQSLDFKKTIASHINPPDLIKQSLQGFAKGAHPMAMLISLLGALAGYYHPIKIRDAAERKQAIEQLIGCMPMLVALTYQHYMGNKPNMPHEDLDYAAQFMYLLFDDSRKTNPVLNKAIDRILILHADHEQNASTSTVRLAGSTLANPYACIAAGTAALWGTAHGGANEAVIKMLTEIGDEKNIGEYIARAKDPNSNFRLMGFGHRVYKNYDPRATVMKQTCDEVLGELGEQNDPLFKIALQLEKIALEDEYFIKRKLYPNVDFYSGIILRAIGIPTALFTSIFALARTVGWLSQWAEMLDDNDFKIGRPRQWYTGPKQRDI